MSVGAVTPAGEHVPRWIFGPCRSAKLPTLWPAGGNVPHHPEPASWVGWSPYEEFGRTTSIAVSTAAHRSSRSRARTKGGDDLCPAHHTIFPERCQPRFHGTAQPGRSSLWLQATTTGDADRGPRRPLRSPHGLGSLTAASVVMPTIESGRHRHETARSRHETHPSLG